MDQPVKVVDESGQPLPLSPEAIRAQLDKVLSSTDIGRAHRLQGFLRYIVEETLSGRADRIKGYAIGLAVYGRDDTFDPQNDPIVRVDAGRLRRLLKHYYLDEGRADPILIALPKGRYIPQFQSRAPIKSPCADAAPQPDPRPRTAPSSHAIAVLPFANLNGHSNLTAFTDGLTQQVITDLAQQKALQVTARNTMMRYKDQAVDIYDLRQALGVAWIVEGSVRKTGNTVRVTAQLTATEDGLNRWAQQYDQVLEPGNELQVQDEVTRAMVAELRQQLGVSTSAEVPAGVRLKTEVRSERRQITVLSCGLVDPSGEFDQLDPEQRFDFIGALHKDCAAIVQQFGGHIADEIDGRVRVYFGYPQAHEDDAERAVQAALSMLRKTTDMRLPEAPALRAHVGIATGEVVVAQARGGGDKPSVAGDVVNIATRLQGQAEPGTLVIGAVTQRLLGGALDSVALERASGEQGHYTAWRVLNQPAAESRFDASRSQRICR